MRRWCAAALILAGAALQGCATNRPIPDGYAGPLATIQDTAIAETSTRVRFFYLSEVDGRSVWTNLQGNRAMNYGKGAQITPVVLERQVPAGHLKLKIEARIAYGAPIMELIHAGTMYSIERVIEADLEPDARYVVRGELRDNIKEVWLEREDSHEHIGQVVAEK